jgi:virginiamycin B lyase
MWKLPGEAPKAYAVYVDERDIVWVSDFGANAVLAFDPRTERWTRYQGSGDGANVRQILGRPGEVYLPESGTNRIMVVKTGSAS